jgi:hypothetical protein
VLKNVRRLRQFYGLGFLLELNSVILVFLSQIVGAQKNSNTLFC